MSCQFFPGKKESWKKPKLCKIHSTKSKFYAKSAKKGKVSNVSKKYITKRYIHFIFGERERGHTTIINIYEHIDMKLPFK